jgi:putative methionine-R-sulfoxide reductase with GAF domain
MRAPDLSTNAILSVTRFARRRSNRKSNAILNVVRCRTSGASIPDLINVVTASTYNLLLAERVSVYLVDRIKGEIWICVSKDPSIAGLTLPIGRGISGQVAKDGKTINVKDCYTDDRFDGSCDKKTGFVTRSMLCMAVPGFDDESKPVAVIQAISKLGAKSFDDEDEEALSAFCNEVKMAMR